MKNVFFIVGPHGVGKTYSVKKILVDIDAEHIDLGPLIRQIHENVSPNTSLDVWINEGETQYGKHFTDEVLCNQIERLTSNTNKQAVIFTGSRSVDGIQYICNRFKLKKPCLIYIDAPYEQLKSNYENREKKTLSDEQFMDVLKREQDMGLERLKKYSMDSNQCIYLQNDYSEVFINQMKQIIKKQIDKDEEVEM